MQYPWFSALLLVAGCGDSSTTGSDANANSGDASMVADAMPGVDAASTSMYSIGGQVYGLTGQLTLQNNGAQALVIDADGVFTIAASVGSGTSYAVTIAGEPEIQRCEVLLGTGTVGASDVSDVEVRCAQQFFFSANDSVSGIELWKSDGTEAGTVLLKDINPNSNSNPVEIREHGGAIYFRAATALNGTELWKSDGTTAGTVMVKDIFEGSFGSSPSFFTSVGDFLIFTASDENSDVEPWITDGTGVGTQRLLDINNAGNSIPLRYANYEGKAVFVADDGNVGRELWISDGTALGTKRVTNLNGASTGVPSNDAFAAYDGLVYFDGTDGVSNGQVGAPSGRQLWRSDGTVDGTTLVRVVNEVGDASVDDFAIVGSRLYFSAFAGGNRGLWSTDGTDSGTRLVSDVDAGSVPLSGPTSLGELGGQLVFSAIDGLGRRLFISDGTAAGTKRISPDTVALQGEVVVAGQQAFFVGLSSTALELWVSDGTLAGTKLVKDIREGGSSSPSNLFALGNSLLFFANDGSNGQELWSTDGTESGTMMVKDINPGAASSLPN